MAPTIPMRRLMMSPLITILQMTTMSSMMPFKEIKMRQTRIWSN
jgi:hypothetical protein